MPTAHLVSGLPCSGKTSYAVALRVDLDCALFSLDQWLITLFGQYSIAAVGHQEHTRRVLACRELIWASAAELLRRSTDVILDDGFFFREHRLRLAQGAAAIGAHAKIHYLDTPAPVLKARLERRNADLPRYNFLVDQDTLRVFEGLFEAPSSGEGVELVVVRYVVRQSADGTDIQ